MIANQRQRVSVGDELRIIRLVKDDVETTVIARLLDRCPETIRRHVAKLRKRGVLPDEE